MRGLMKAALAALILGFASQGAYSFGPMNIFTRSAGVPWSNSSRTPERSPCIPLERALITKSDGVFGSIHQGPLGNTPPTTVMPVLILSGRFSTGSILSIMLVSGTPSFMFRQPAIRKDNHSASGTERSQNICTFILSGRPLNASSQAVPLRNNALGIDNLARPSSATLVRALASEIFCSVPSLNRSSASSAAAASLLWAIIEPDVAITAAIAANATAIPAITSAKSHHSPLWPRNRVEAALFVLSIVSVIGGVTVTIFGVVVLRENRKRR